MTQQLRGKTAIITGAARGIGEATARIFAAQGARVLVADIDETAGPALAAELPGSLFRRVDVAREEDVAAAVDLAVDAFGRLDIIVNNAGLAGIYGSIAKTDSRGWDDTMKILLDGVFYGVKHAARVMIPNRSGRILATASVAGLAGGIGAHCYTAAKHGVIGLVRSAAAELAQYAICVNAIAPGVTVTPLAIAGAGGVEEANRFSASVSPLGAPITPEDIAGGFLYLAGEYGRHITGQTIAIDGGYTLAGFRMAAPSFA